MPGPPPGVPTDRNLIAAFILCGLIWLKGKPSEAASTKMIDDTCSLARRWTDSLQRHLDL